MRDVEKLRIVALGAMLAASTAVSAKSNAVPNADLIGTWRLVSAVATTSTGTRNSHPYGDNPTGVLTYTADGRVVAMIAYDGRSALSGDRVSAPAAERAEAFATFFAYSGTFDTNGTTVTHHVQIASVPNWVGTDLVRVVALLGDRLTLTTPPISVGDQIQVTKLVWDRVKSSP